MAVTYLTAPLFLLGALGKNLLGKLLSIRAGYDFELAKSPTDVVNLSGKLAPLIGRKAIHHGFEIAPQLSTRSRASSRSRAANSQTHCRACFRNSVRIRRMSITSAFTRSAAAHHRPSAHVSPKLR